MHLWAASERALKNRVHGDNPSLWRSAVPGSNLLPALHGSHAHGGCLPAWAPNRAAHKYPVLS